MHLAHLLQSGLLSHEPIVTLGLPFPICPHLNSVVLPTVGSRSGLTPQLLIMYGSVSCILHFGSLRAR